MGQHLHAAKEIMKRAMRKTILIAGVAICIICAALISYGFMKFTQKDTLPSQDLTLSGYPELFAKEAIIVIGENASLIEIESAEVIAANLENLTGNKPEIINPKKKRKFINSVIVLITIMENISFKQWITAGALSGLIIGILVFCLLYCIYIGISLRNISFFLTSSLVSNVFLGVIIGIILFFVYNKVYLKRTLFKCLLISIVTVVLMFLLSYYFFYLYLNKWEDLWISSLIPFSSVVYINITMIHLLPVLWIGPPLLTGAAFGFLINYFINRMERKASN